MKIIIEIALSVWLTSSLFMLYFWGTAFIATYVRDGKILLMPFGQFLYIHFCPIVHTIKCFKIMQRYAELKAQTAKRGM